jgi:rhomboid protease GluP
VGINCAVYVAMVIHGVSANHPTQGELIQFGANSVQKVLVDGEWWRLLTAAFVHIGFLHLATNMWCLWNLGLLGEPLLGPAGLLAVYVLTGVAGNLLSTVVNSANLDMVGAGASGAVFGLAGVLILLLKAKLLPVPPAEIHRLRRSVIYFALLNFVIGGTTMFIPTSIRIDNMAHLGGFLCGLALGAPLVPRIGAAKSEYVFRSWATYGVMTVLLLAFAYGVARPR